MGKQAAKVEGERARIGFDKQALLFSGSVTEVRITPSDLTGFLINKENEAGLFKVSAIKALVPSPSLQSGDGRAGRGILMHIM